MALDVGKIFFEEKDVIAYSTLGIGRLIYQLPIPDVYKRQAQKAAEQAEQVSENDTPVVASEYTDIAIAQVDNYVNVRSEPNTDSEVLGKLYNNSAGTILETTDNGDVYKRQALPEIVICK